MCLRLGGVGRLTIQVAPPALQEGQPLSAISAKYTYVREGMEPLRRVRIPEAIDKQAIVTPFPYLLPTH